MRGKFPLPAPRLDPDSAADGERHDMARPGSSKREAIVAAAKALLWERGYEATSPRDVLDRSGAGQGSLYHHFSGKREVAAAALAEMAEEEIAAIDRLFAPDSPPLDRVHAYLTRERQALRGCRLARLANEAAMELIQPLTPSLIFSVNMPMGPSRMRVARPGEMRSTRPARADSPMLAMSSRLGHSQP